MENVALTMFARNLLISALKTINEDQEAIEQLRKFFAAVVPTSGPALPSRLTIKEYARRENVSQATVHRWKTDGMPTIPVGTTVRIDPLAAEEWRRARGRKPTTPKPAEPDVASALSAAGLRLVGGK